MFGIHCFGFSEIWCNTGLFRSFNSKKKRFFIFKQSHDVVGKALAKFSDVLMYALLYKISNSDFLTIEKQLIHSLNENFYKTLTISMLISTFFLTLL